MKVKLLKKLRKESKKLKLIRDEAYQYIVTDNPHNIFEPKLDTYYSGNTSVFDDAIIKWFHQCRRDWILSEISQIRIRTRKSRIRIYKE